MTKLTSFQSDSNSFLRDSTISSKRLLLMLCNGFYGPEGLNSPYNNLASSIHFALSLSSLVASYGSSKQRKP